MRFILLKKKSLIYSLVLVILLAGTLVGTSVMGSAAVWNGKAVKKMPIHSVMTDNKSVAISFDASWGTEQTPLLLKILEEADASATFFSAGFWAQENRDLLKQLSDSGRMEIGTHSNNHPDMAKLSASKIRLELETSIKIIEGITGKKVDLFRAPYGSYNSTLLREAEKMGLYTIQWSVDSMDFKGLSAADMANKVVSGAKSGSIILMHNDGENTAAALPAIIEGIKNKGLSLITVGELIYKDNYTIDSTGKQIRSF